jgi:hypothetical protein
MPHRGQSTAICSALPGQLPGIYIIDDDGLRVFAGPFASEATAIAWIIQRQETMNRHRSERTSAIH